MRVPDQDSATGRGVKTAVQAMVGFLVGLFLAIWTVPGVPEVVTAYAKENLVSVLLVVGVPSGLVSFGWNYFRKDVNNW